MRKKKKNSFPIICVLVFAVGIFLFAIYLLLSLGFKEKYDVTTDTNQYQNVIGEYAIAEYQDKMGVSEEIFPPSVGSLNVKDFKMIHYDPFDKQFLAYLVVDYDNIYDYQKEMERLTDLGIDEYEGIFGVTGFDYYQLVAMYADSYQGFVYALTDGKSHIIYVELILCNYFYDFDYTKEIPKEYLPTGFDATKNNPYRQEMMQEH